MPVPASVSVPDFQDAGALVSYNAEQLVEFCEFGQIWETVEDPDASLAVLMSAADDAKEAIGMYKRSAVETREQSRRLTDQEWAEACETAMVYEAAAELSRHLFTDAKLAADARRTSLAVDIRLERELPLRAAFPTDTWLKGAMPTSFEEAEERRRKAKRDAGYHATEMKMCPTGCGNPIDERGLASLKHPLPVRRGLLAEMDGTAGTEVELSAAAWEDLECGTPAFNIREHIGLVTCERCEDLPREEWETLKANETCQYIHPQPCGWCGQAVRVIAGPDYAPSPSEAAPICSERCISAFRTQIDSEMAAAARTSRPELNPKVRLKTYK